jgi:uncharacterized protein involved in type VI secretion and phage assembly
MPTNEIQEAVLRLAQAQQRRFHGKFRGIVTDNDDPDQQGRIRARVPELFDGDATGWAMACVPFAPPQKGLLTLPEIDSNVWIEFEGGDPSRPIWAGCWWPQGQGPDVSSPQVRRLESVSGHKITLDDTDGQETVIIEDKNGATITLDQQGVEIKKGGMKIQLTDSQVSINDGALTVM